MRKALFLILVLLLAGVFAPAVPARAQNLCAGALERVYAEPDWQARLMDPVLGSPQAIRERAELYRPAYDCLAGGLVPATGENARLYDLAGYFLQLAAPLAGPEAERLRGQGYLARFDEIDDPAVTALRDEAGIPEPPGYLYIWMFASTADMPPSIQGFFSGGNVRGLTLLTRYIVVLDDVVEASGGNAALEDFLTTRRSETLSHELVHAYVKSAAGASGMLGMPEWYDEGLAVYFSGSHEPSSFIYIDGQGRHVTTVLAPENYARYRDAFAFLERAYGRERFLALIRESVLSGAPELLYQDLGIASEEDMYALMVGERRERALERLATYLAVMTGASMLLWLLLGLVARLRFGSSRESARGVVRLPAERPLVPELSEVYAMRDRGDVPGLMRMLQFYAPGDPFEAGRVRRLAALSLAELTGMSAPDAANALIDALSDRSPGVRAAAALALGSLDPRALAPSVPITGASPSGGESGEGSPRAIAALLQVVQHDPVEAVRFAATDALYRVGGAGVLRPLVANARTSSEAYQRWFAGWLGGIGLEDVLVDLYPWAKPGAQEEITAWLRARLHENGRLNPRAFERLDQARRSGSGDLYALSAGVLDD